MKPLYTILTIALFLFSNPSQTCPVFITSLKGYVGLEPGYATQTELREFDANQVFDTSGMPNTKISAYQVSVHLRRIGDTSRTFIGYFSVNDQFNKSLDTVINKLNLQDSLFLRFSTEWSSSKTSMDDDWFPRFHIMESRQTYVLSTEEVVQLKRNPNGTDYKVYPSPAEDHVSVQFNFTRKKSGTIELFDAYGRSVAQVKSDDLSKPNTFDLKEAASGTYYVHTQFDGENFVKKIVKP